MLKLTQRGTKGIYQITGRIKGVRIRESTRTHSRPHAEAILAKRQQEILNALTFGPKKTAIFAEAVVHYLNTGGEHRYLGKLLDIFGEMKLSEISETDVAQAAHTLYPKRKASTHVRCVYTPMTAVFTAAAKADLCESRKFQKPKIKKPSVQFADDKWFDRLLPELKPSMTAIMLFMTFTGARVSEAINLTWNDLDIETTTAILTHTKNQEPQRRKLPPIVIQAILKLDRGELFDRVFGYKSRHSIKNNLQRACRRAGVHYLSPHKAGRHAFAARLLKQGYNLRLVQAAGGWKSISVVADTYGHLEQTEVDHALVNSDTELATRKTREAKIIELSER